PLVGACSLRAPRVTEPVCNTDRQCRSGQVCFANECRSPASALGAVMVEVTPPTSSPYAAVQRTFDLKASAVGNIDLPLPARFEGTLLQDLDADAGTSAVDGGVPVAGARLDFVEAAPLIPGRAPALTAQTDTTGAFAVQLTPAAWSLRISPPAPLPPFDTAVAEPDVQGAVLRIPAPSRLTRMSGAIKSAGRALASARV